MKPIKISTVSTLIFLALNNMLFSQDIIWSNETDMRSIINILIDYEDNILVVGSGLSSGSNLQKGIIKKFDSEGNLLWTVYDTVSANYSTFYFLTTLANHEIVILFHTVVNGALTPHLSRYSSDGELLLLQECQVLNPFFMNSFGDSLVIVSCAPLPRAYITGPNGIPVRSFQVNDQRIFNGSVVILNDTLYISATITDSDGIINADAFIAKFNLKTGEQIWRYDIEDAYKTEMNVSQSGNIYFGATYATHKTPDTIIFPYMLIKFSPENNITWEKQWHGVNTSFEGIWINDLVIDDSEEKLVICGNIQRQNESASHSAYFDVFITDNGELNVSREWQFNSCSSGAGACTFQRNDIVVGSKWIDSNGSYACLEKYSLPPVEIDAEPFAIPSKLLLRQNFPNPFNQTTVIQYSLPKNGNVELVIYNLQGQKIETLVSKFQAKGDYAVKWKAENIPTGVYLYTLETPFRVLCKKLIHLK